MAGITEKKKEKRESMHVYQYIYVCMLKMYILMHAGVFIHIYKWGLL